jgi:hypothetical protein
VGRPLTYDEVLALWLAGGGASTAGILSWFAPPVVQEWVEDEMELGAIGSLRLMGGDPRGLWEGLTGGSNRVADVTGTERDPEFSWDEEWALITVRDPETSAQVLLDGNKRAVQLQHAAESGALAFSQPVRIVTGTLNVLVVRIAKAVAPLWR